MSGGLIELGILILVLAAAGSAAWASLRAAPFVPTQRRDLERILALADVKPGETVVDLGSGDGRILFGAAARGATAIGYEISLLPWLVSWVRWLFFPGRRRVKIFARDFLHADLSSASTVFFFLTPGAMRRVVPVLQARLKPGTKVLSYAFQIPGWTPIWKDKPDPRRFAVWVYRRP